MYASSMLVRADFEPKWANLAALTTTQRFDSFDGGSTTSDDGDNNSFEQYSSVPPRALRDFANRFTSLLIHTSLTESYFSLNPTQRAIIAERLNIFNPQDQSDEAEVRRAELEGADEQEITQSVYEKLRLMLTPYEMEFTKILRDAKFTNAVGSAVFEQLAFGTGILCVTGRGVGGKQKLSVKCVPLKNVAMLGDGEEGFLHFFRKYNMTWEAAKRIWGKSIKEPYALISKSDEQKRTEEHVFVECLIHIEATLDEDSMYERHVIMPEHSKSEDRMGVVSEDAVSVKHCPYIVLQWLPKAGSPYGLSVFDTAESDIIAINEAVVNQTQLTDLSVRTPILVDALQYPNPRNMDISPASLISAEFSAHKQGDPIRPLHLGNDKAFAPLQAEIQRLQQSIEQMTYRDLIIPDGNRNLNAEEILIRTNAMLQQIGVSVIDVSFDAIRQTGYACLRVIAKSTLYADRLPADLLSNEDEVDLSPNSPMISIMKQAKVAREQTLVLNTQQAMPSSPVPALLDLAAVGRNWFREGGIDEDKIYSAAKTDEILEAQQAEQEAAQIAQAGQGAQQGA